MHITELTSPIHMEPKRIIPLMSPATRVDIGRTWKILILPKPLTWGDNETMDGCCIANPTITGAFHKFAIAVKETCKKEIDYMFQFRAAHPGRAIAKGTMRTPLPGLTSWEGFLSLVESQFGNLPENVDSVDAIMDKDVLKVFPWDDISEPTIVEFNGDFIGFHRADDHDSRKSKCGSQLTRFNLLKSGKQHPLINQVSLGDRRGYTELCKLNSDDEFKSKFERAIGYGLPITESMIKEINTYRIGKYVSQFVVSTSHNMGSRFLTTDPAVKWGQAWVPKGYLPKQGKQFAWISTPIVDNGCVQFLEREDIREFNANVIVIDSKMATNGHRDFDGDLTKIIDLEVNREYC